MISDKLRAKRATATAVRGESRGRWRSVAIIGAATGCAAVQTCKGKRYLCREAPLLPLEGCDAAVCDCKYRHFEDRRGAPRRAEEKGMTPTRVENNRRKNRDRRAND
jgi:hypothetical protein